MGEIVDLKKVCVDVVRKLKQKKWEKFRALERKHDSVSDLVVVPEMITEVLGILLLLKDRGLMLQDEEKYYSLINKAFIDMRDIDSLIDDVLRKWVFIDPSKL